MKRRGVLIGTAVLLACSGHAWAGRCLGYPLTRIVWCDDFDTYCTANHHGYCGPPLEQPYSVWPGYPPEPDNRCTTSDTSCEWYFRRSFHWPNMCGPGMSSMAPVTDIGSVYNPPYSLVYQGFTNSAQRHEHDMTPEISTRHPGYNAVNGTDAHPLVLMYWSWCSSPTGNYTLSPMYIELMLDNDRAPTDYVWTGCSGQDVGPYPIVCQQWLWNQTAAQCPNPSTWQVHASLCFGWLAQLDRQPCENHRPTMYNAATFDGLKWYDLQTPLVFPGYGTFRHPDGGAWFTLTIKTTSYVVKLESSTRGTSEATIPRQYTGPFNKVGIGTAPGCQLDSSGQCIEGTYGCWNYAEHDSRMGWLQVYMDTPVLLDGVYVSLAGACCAVDGTCSVVDQATCEAGNGRFHDIGSTCASVLCCPLPFADADADGDVDQVDFAAWQRCYANTGGGILPDCDCWDREPDGDVDADDLTAFSACWTGPNVPWNEDQPSGCVP